MPTPPSLSLRCPYTLAAPWNEVIANSQGSSDEEEWCPRGPRSHGRPPTDAAEPDKSGDEHCAEGASAFSRGNAAAAAAEEEEEGEEEDAPGKEEEAAGAAREGAEERWGPDEDERMRKEQQQGSRQQQGGIASAGLLAQREFIARLPAVSREPPGGAAAPPSRLMRGSGLAAALHRAQAGLRCARAEWERCRRPGELRGPGCHRHR